MISRVKNLPENFASALAYSRIEAIYNTYKDTVGAEIFVQRRGGKVTSLLGKTGSGYSLCAAEDADFTELDSWFRFFGAEVFCDSDTAERLSPAEKSIYPLLMYRSDESPPKTDSETCTVSEVYTLLQNGADGAVILPPFDCWYTDFCARFNHGAAMFAARKSAVAVCGFLTARSALVTGVAVSKSMRKQGLGSAVLQELCYKTRKSYPTCVIFAAADEKTSEFYKKNGFISSGQTAVCKY